MANERTEILYGPRAEIHTIKTGKIKHTLRYVGNNHYVTTPSSEKHDVQRTHYSLDDALDHLRKQGHQISKTDLHPSNKTPIVKESNMKDFKDFVKTTYAGLMEVEGLNESKSFTGRDAKKAMFSHPEISKAFSKENAAIYPASSPEIKRLGKNHAIVSATNQDSAHSDTLHGIRYHVVHDDNGNPTGHSVHLYTHTYPIVVEHGKHIQGGVAEGNGEGQSLEDAFKKAKSSYEKHYEKSATKPKAKMKFD